MTVALISFEQPRVQGKLGHRHAEEQVFSNFLWISTTFNN